MKPEYSINCTGDACVGDHVCFQQATFTGSFRRAKFAGNVEREGEIIRDSYGSAKGQHTFTIRLLDGTEMRIKGRNLYREETRRKPWADEAKRQAVLGEKHQRGDRARARKADPVDWQRGESWERRNEEMFG